MSNPGFLSKRVKKKSQTGLTTDRYQFLGLDQAEPDLGDPTVGISSIGAKPYSGSVSNLYVLVSDNTGTGSRYWTTQQNLVTGGVIQPGAITVRNNGTIVGATNQVFDVNFVGNGVTVTSPGVGGGSSSVNVTISVTDLNIAGSTGQIPYTNSSGKLVDATDLIYSPTSLFVGIGSTIPTAKLDVLGNLKISGIATIGSIQFSSGIITATSGVVTYYGDGTKLSGILTPNSNVTFGSIVGTSLSISGISTLGVVTAGNIYSTGIITASSFSGNATSATYATSAGIASALTSNASVNTSGIITATSFSGTLHGTADFAGSANNANNATNATNATYATYATNAGTSTSVIGGIASVTSLSVSGISTLGVVTAGNIYSTGIITATTFSGSLSGNATSATYATNAGTSTSVIGGISSVTQLSVSGISTLGVVTAGNIYSTGIITATTFSGSLSGNATSATYATNAGTSTSVIGGISSVTQLSVSGISTLGVVTAGNIYSTGIITATTFSGSLSGNATSATYATSAGIASALTSNASVNTSGIITAQYLYANNNVQANQLNSTVATGSPPLNVTSTTLVNNLNVQYLNGQLGSYYTNAANLTGTAPASVITQSNGFSVTGNLSVTGNISIAGTSISVSTNTLTISDRDIVLGVVTTNFGSSGDVSNDTTANHGGIAIASTVGNPLISLQAAGINTFPDTYKQFQWIKTGTFAGLNTDAWLSNYAIGIGSTQIPSGVILAAGGVQITNNSITASNINASGVITATTFSGSLGGNATSATYATSAGIATYATSSGIATYATSSGIATYATNAGTSTSVVGGIASVTSLNVSGISTLGTVKISSGIVTATSGVVTYYGDGSNLSGINAFSVINQPLISSTVYPIFANNVGVTTVGISTTKFVFLPSTGYVGIGTTNPAFPLTVTDGNSVTLTSLTGCNFDVTSNVASYSQANIRNTSNASLASADYIVTADTGTDSTNYLDLGINNSGFTTSSWTINGALDGYLYTSNTNLSIGVASATKYLSFFAGGTLASNEQMRVTTSGVGIGTTNPSQPLHIQGNARVTGAVYDSTNSPGSSGQVLQSTVTGTQWTTTTTTVSGGKFDTTIDNVVYVQPTGELAIVGVGTTTTQITTLPAGSSKYIIHSIHVTNISNGDAEISGGFLLNSRAVPASISVSVGQSGSAGVNTVTVGSASTILVGMSVIGTGNIGETTGIGSTAGFQFNTYVTSVDGNIVSLSKPMSGYAVGVATFTPTSKFASRLPVPVGSAVELLKQPMILNALDSIVLQSTGAGSGIGSTSTAAISQTANSNILTVTAGAAITNFITAGQLIQGTGSNTGIQTNTYVGVGYIPGSLSVPMTRPATSTLSSQVLSFTEVVVPQDGALQATIVYQSTTDTSFQNGTGTVSAASSNTTSVTAGLSTVPVVYYGTGNTYPSTIQSIKVTNISDGSIYPGGDYSVSVGIGNSDTVFSWLAYNMVIPKNSSIELCEAPKRLGIGQSIFAVANTPYTIEIQVAGKQKTS